MNNQIELNVVLSQFVCWLQTHDAWPCRRPIGKAPEPLTPDEVVALRRQFAERLRNEPTEHSQT